LELSEKEVVYLAPAYEVAKAPLCNKVAGAVIEAANLLNNLGQYPASIPLYGLQSGGILGNRLVQDVHRHITMWGFCPLDILTGNSSLTLRQPAPHRTQGALLQ
jgi:hypothetical protein